MPLSRSSTLRIHTLSQVNIDRAFGLISVAHVILVLSLIISPTKDHYITSAADAVVAKHPLPAGKPVWNTELKPLKICHTKHSGQQGLSYRSDGIVFATAGWDAHIRVYSGKTMKELAVLKWHKTGCHATSFAAIQTPGICAVNGATMHAQNRDTKVLAESSSTVGTVQRRREEKAQTSHWLAVGAKDGKVSLWNIY